MHIPLKLKEKLSAAERIVITTHFNPDGDAIGSALAMYHYFLLKGYEVAVMVPNSFPDFLAWMKGARDILIYEQDADQCSTLLKQAEIIFCLDYNAIQRTGNMQEAILGASAARVLIDHHLEPDKEHFDFLFSTVETSSTGELVYNFILAYGDADLINVDIATGIYVGIITDTGSFSYSCNHEETYRVVAELFRTGIDGGHIHRLVYDTFSESRLRLLGYCLSEKLVVLPGYKTAYIALSREELDRFNYQVGDTEGVVNYALSIKGIRFAVFFTERKDKVRLSFRSVGDFSVNEFAGKYFSGGGHKNAAGGDSYLSMDETIERFLTLLPEFQDQLSDHT